MKKLIALLLALAMLLSVAACGKKQTPAEPDISENTEPEPVEEPVEDPAVPLPSVGDKVEGFTAKELRDFPLVGATIVLFEHDRTGAQLVYIANSDTNRVFDLTFFTRAVDNTGIPHVFEHSTLDGSAKYPSKALFFNLSYQTYNTYMNAMTGALYTTYPVASLSEEQLLRYADYYTDSCFFPMIMEDESIFREEAWRYRLSDMDDDLTIEGTVYSEMKGALTLEGTAMNNFYRAAFPGSTVGNESGGEPEHIPEMTWEHLKAYHDEYYHPSNCCAYLYGEFQDYTAFLKILDEAFEPFEKREFTFEDPDYVPLTESVNSMLAFPVENGSDTANSSAAFYGFICPGLKDDPQEELILNTLTDLLIAEASPLMRNLRKTLPSGEFGTYIDIDGPEDMIVFYSMNMNESDMDLFKKTVDESLAEIAEKGFSDELVDSIKSSLELSTKLTGESTDIGVDLITTIASYYASTGQHFGYLDYVEGLDRIDEWNAQGLYTKAISEWMLNADVNVLTLTFPKPGLREALDAQEAERLAAVKASMSEAELQAIIDMTNASDEEDDAAKYVKQLQAVTVGSLPEELKTYEVSDEKGKDGVRYIDARADVDGVGSVVILLDASALPQEDIHWFNLYMALVGEMDTASHDDDEISLLISRYLYNGDIRLSIAEEDNEMGYTPRLRAGWIATDEDMAKAYDLMYELLYESDFSDYELMEGQVSQMRASLKSAANQEPYNLMIYRSFGASDPLYRYYSYISGIEYYDFLGKVDEMLLSDPAPVKAKLEAVQDYFRNRDGAAVLFAGNEDSIKVNRPLAEAFMAKLDSKPREAAVYSFEEPAQREALIVNSNVQFNGITADYETLGLDYYSGDLDALSSYVSDAFLYPMLRDQYGAYSVMAGFTEDHGAYIVSYRDPNVAETFDVYADLPDFLEETDITQEELDGYILSSYSYYAKGSGELSGAISAAVDALCGTSQEDVLDYMKELKAMTPEKLRKYADLYRKLVENGMMFTAGGSAAVNANLDLYDAVLNPFGAVDATQTEFEDVPEGHGHYEAVRFVFEEMIMDPLGETVFGVDEKATVGELSGALYALIGGDYTAQQESIDFFAQYGIIGSGTSASEVLTGKAADSILSSFSAAVSVPYKSDKSLADKPLTRGELAEIIMAYTLPLIEE